MLWRWTLLLLAAPLAGGCGGEYLLIGPDVVALPGENAPLVVRLQRREFWLYWPPMRDAAVTFRSDGGELRCARTDKHGYAVTGFPAPAEPSVVRVALHHQDELGYAAAGHVHVFALSPEVPIVAVDMDCLPLGGNQAASAAEALRRIGKQAQIVYFTQHCSAAPEYAHQALEKAAGRRMLPGTPVIPSGEAGTVLLRPCGSACPTCGRACRPTQSRPRGSTRRG